MNGNQLQIGDKIRFVSDVPSEDIPPRPEPKFKYQGAAKSDTGTIIGLDESAGTVTVALDVAARTPLTLAAEDQNTFEKSADRLVDDFYKRNTPDETLQSLQSLLPGTRIVFVATLGYQEVAVPPEEPEGPEAKLGDFATVVDLAADASSITVCLDHQPDFRYEIKSENANFIWPLNPDKS